MSGTLVKAGVWKRLERSIEWLTGWLCSTDDLDEYDDMAFAGGKDIFEV